MLRRILGTFLIVFSIVCILLSLPCAAQRVLLVTTEQMNAPWLGSSQDGMYLAADLVGAGIPFDIRTYGRFVTMDLSPYDVLILNGHTSPTPIADVSTKCQQAKAAGKKIFINGNQPYLYYSPTGQLIQQSFYAQQLFGVTKATTANVTGITQIPAWLQKDPDITALGVRNKYVQTYNPASSMPIEIRLGGRIVGLLGPDGGLIDGLTSYALSVIDYGRLVNYLRHGIGTIVGFANDRVAGKPIVSWEVHAHAPGRLSGANSVLNLSEAYSIPLDVLMLYSAINPSAVATWNAVTSPLIAKGSHSRTHPSDWPNLPNVLYESTQALIDQAAFFPDSVNYFSFPGGLNPTAQQIDQIYEAGTLFGGNGLYQRTCITPEGGSIPVQTLPISLGWFHELAKCVSTPAWPSQTMQSDSTAVTWQRNFDEIVLEEFHQNVKYGMYTQGYIHDTYMDPALAKSIRGEPVHIQVERAASLFRDQGVHFMFTHDLMARLQDYIAGNVTYVTNPDGSLTITANRPASKANEIKIGWKDGRAPVASGQSVLSQQLAGPCLYVALRPEVTSTVHINWVDVTPAAPIVTTSSAFISDTTPIEWMEPVYTPGVLEYQYTVGTTSGGHEIQGWTSVGTATSTTLSGVPLVQGGTYYVSVRARQSNGEWSPVGVSPPYVVDLTAPTCIVTDDGQTQVGNGYLNARWTMADPESGIQEAKYAVGTAPGLSDVLGWSPAFGNGVQLTDPPIVPGGTYYITLRARNGAKTWTESHSDGILIEIPRTIGMALNCSDYTNLSIPNLVVTAVFGSECYVEDVDRSAGAKALGLPSTIRETDRLVITAGMFETTDQGRALMIEMYDVTGSGVVKPLYIPNRYLGGSDRRFVPGPTNGIGPNNVGLLVTTSGKVTEIGQGWIRIDDGSISRSDTAGYTVKVQVSSVPSGLREGSYVLVTGISAIEQVGPNRKRLILTRRSSDLTMLLQ